MNSVLQSKEITTKSGIITTKNVKSDKENKHKKTTPTICPIPRRETGSQIDQTNKLNAFTKTPTYQNQQYHLLSTNDQS